MDNSMPSYSMPPLALLPLESQLHKALYGDEDSRENIFTLLDGDPIKQKTTGIGCLILAEKLKPHLKEKAHILKTTVRKLSEYLKAVHSTEIFKEDEKFLEEPVAGFGTAFLVGKKLVLTAAHCVCKKDSDELKSPEELAKIRVAFNFAFKNAEDSQISLPKDEVFSIKEVVAYQITKGVDWALVKLDQAVSGKNIPLELDFQSEVASNLKVYMLGHPMGLPMKYTPNGIVAQSPTTAQEFFSVKIDAFAGNSGSPLFDEQSGKVIGILISGNDDYHLEDGVIQPYRVSVGAEPEHGQKLAEIVSGVQNYVEACRKNSRKGKAKALFQLAYQIHEGIHIKKDIEKAARYFEKGIVKEFFPEQALYNAGRCFYDVGDFESALAHFEESKDPGALVSRGICLYEGKGVAPNHAEARNLFQRALEAGYQAAQDYLNKIGPQSVEATSSTPLSPTTGAHLNTSHTKVGVGATSTHTVLSNDGPATNNASHTIVEANGYSSSVVISGMIPSAEQLQNFHRR